MKTQPDLTVREHLERLLTALELLVPNIRQYELLFVDAAAISRVGNEWVVSASKVMRQPQFEEFFEDLCDQGHPWINLAGDAPWRDAFLVRVEHGMRVNSTEIAVNVPGPSLDLDQRPLKATRLRIEEP